MPVIAIVGAGPGLGSAVALKFAREGYSVALIARNAEKLAAVEARVAETGATVKTYLADVRDAEALASAVDAAAADLGPIDVLQFSPVPNRQFLKPVVETSAEDLRAAVEFSIVGSATAIGRVLPGMIERGTGTVLLVNGSTAATPKADYAGTSVAFAGESVYGAMLHESLTDRGVNVRQLIIPFAIDGDDPLHASTALADRLWALHTTPGEFRSTVG